MDSTRLKYRPRVNTQGIKGARQKRINMAFDMDVYEYIKRKAQNEGVTMTRFVNEAIRERMEVEDHEQPQKG